MKKVIVLVFSLILTVMSYGQDYYPLIKDGKTWNVLNVIRSGGWPPFDTTFNTQSFNLSGDTIINSVSYKKLYSSTEEIPVNWSLYGFMKEDTNKKVWLRKLNSEEFLMYDFSVNVGDSILIGYISPELFYYSVDSITLVTINGASRNKYWISMDEFDYHETWIEGIGSNKGIVWSGSAMLLGGWSWLLCLSESEEMIYMNPNYNLCYMTSTDIIEKKETLITVYPNPAKDKLYFSLSNDIDFEEIIILNSQGKIVINSNFNGNNNFSVDLVGLPNGIYLYMITTRQKKVLSGKVIINLN